MPDFSEKSIPFKCLEEVFDLQKKLGQGGQGSLLVDLQDLFM